MEIQNTGNIAISMYTFSPNWLKIYDEHHLCDIIIFGGTGMPNYYNVDTISLVTVAMETLENKPCVYLLMHFNVFYTYR